MWRCEWFNLIIIDNYVFVFYRLYVFIKILIFYIFVDKEKNLVIEEKKKFFNEWFKFDLNIFYVYVIYIYKMVLI